jgi:hypothetical protein
MSHILNLQKLISSNHTCAPGECLMSTFSGICDTVTVTGVHQDKLAELE